MAPQQKTVVDKKSAWAFESRALAVERFLDRRQYWILAAWSLLYFACMFLRARAKPFWYDELLTVLEARQSTLAAALRAGGNADWMPPLTHIIFYLTDKLVGHGELAFRLAPMIGFWTFCLCLFQFVRQRTSIYFAFVALCLPFATRFFTYSYEARSYAIVLGFCGIALLSWQAAADGRRRTVSLPVLAVAIAAAILNHYWAVFLYLPLAGGEAWRNYRQRRVDWPVWIAFAIGGVPLLIELVLILGLVHQNLHPWSRAHLGDYFRFYSRNFRIVVFLLPAAILAGAWRVLGGRKEEPGGLRSSAVRDYEWVAAGLFLLAPCAAITAALIVPPHIYVDRYLAMAIAGFALLGAFAAADLAGRRAAIGCICVLAALSPFLSDVIHTRLHRKNPNPFLAARALRQGLAKYPGPIVVADYITFLEVWYYAPNRLKPRIIGLNDERAALRFLHKDDTDGNGLRALGIPFLPYREVATSGKDLLVYVARRNWVAQEVSAEGGTLDPLIQRGGPHHGILFLAHIPRENATPD
jgi:hypothetical protein